MNSKFKSYAEALSHNLSEFKNPKPLVVVSNTKLDTPTLETPISHMTLLYTSNDKYNNQDERILLEKTGVSYHDAKAIYNYLQEHDEICYKSQIIKINNKNFIISLLDDPQPLGTYIYVAHVDGFNSYRPIGHQCEFDLDL